MKVLPTSTAESTVIVPPNILCVISLTTERPMPAPMPNDLGNPPGFDAFPGDGPGFPMAPGKFKG